MEPDSSYEDAPCGLLTTTPAGVITRVNGTFSRWLGYQPDQLVQKRSLQHLLAVGCRIFHQTHWLPLLQMQGSVAEVQLDFIRSDGQMVPALVNAIRRSTDGVPLHDDLAVFPASDRRQYERELLYARKRAEELLASERAAQEALNQALRLQEQEARSRAVLAEQLVGIVSHDLRSPLNAVLIGADYLKTVASAPNQTRTATRIATAANRASRLISDLLDLTQARLGSGLRVSREPIDLHAVVADCLEELRLGSPGLAVTHAKSGDGHCSVDPDRMAQVVTNLVANASTYGARNREIAVRTVVDGREASVEVHNFGDPIPEDLLPHLFEPLKRGEQQVQRGSRSVGLGLFIVHQIALAHQGKVEVRSTAEEGTTLAVRVPASDPHAQPATGGPGYSRPGTE